MPANVLEENSNQMDRHKRRFVFHTLIGNSEVCAEVQAPQSGGDGAPERQKHTPWQIQPMEVVVLNARQPSVKLANIGKITRAAALRTR